MSDPFSTAASIIAVIQASSKVVQYVSTARGCAKDRKQIRDQIQACDDILQQLQEGIDGSEEGQEWSRRVEALEAPGAPLGRLWLILQVINTKLQPKNGMQRAAGALAWPFKEKEISKILNSLEHEKALLELALTNQNRQLIQGLKQNSRKNGELLQELVQIIEGLGKDQLAILTTMSDGLEDIQSSQSYLARHIDRLHFRQDAQESEQERVVILKWINAVDYDSDQQELLRRRQPGSGRWLVQSPVYHAWLDTPGESLLCEGIPGAGKTIMTCTIIDDTLQRYGNTRGIGFAYIYLNYKRQSKQGLDELLGSLLTQLLHDAPIPAVVKEIYNQCAAKRSKPSIQELSQALQEVIRGYSRVFLFVDALDECQDANGCCDNLITELLNLQRAAGASIFATSRPIPGISSRFSGLKTDIRASEDDIIRYLDGRMTTLPGFVSRQPALQDEIKRAILNAVDGMFLLAQLYADSLMGKRSPKAIKQVLGSLETGETGSKAYRLAYRSVMERIRSQAPDKSELAMEALTWIACVTRPLHVNELQHALAIEQNTDELDVENLVEITDITSSCCGLVTIDKTSNIIRLIHHTTQDFLARTQEDWFQDPHSMIASSCLAYISFKTFVRGPVASEAEFSERLATNPFYSYAASNWAYHYRKSSRAAREAASYFLSHKALVNASSQVICPAWFRYNCGGFLTTHFTTSFIPSFDITGLHLASMFGIAEETNMVSLADINAADRYGRTPLICAALNACVSTSRFLLDKGADVNATSETGSTALTYVAYLGATGVITETIECLGARRDETVAQLHADYLALAELLLDRNAGFKDGNSLSAAANSGNLAVAKLLLDAGAAICPPSGPNSQIKGPVYPGPIHNAASDKDDSSAMMGLLLDRGADINAREQYGWSPLSVAVASGNLNIARMLLERGANVQSEDDFGRTALWLAILRDPPQMVRLLLNYGAKLNSSNFRQDNTLVQLIGIRFWHSRLTRLLYEMESGEAEADFYASSRHFPPNTIPEGHNVRPYTSLLAEFRSYLNTRDCFGMTPLCTAVAHGQIEITTALLAMKAVDITLSDKMGRDALWWARAKANLSLESLLLEEAKLRGRTFSDVQVQPGVVAFYQDASGDDDTNFRCDVCLLDMSEGQLLHCDVCRGGDVDICLMCYEFGGRCENEAHELEPMSVVVRKGWLG